MSINATIIPELPVEKKTIRAVVYVRVSSEEQAKRNFSIPQVQIPECKEYIREMGWELIDVYTDEAKDCNSFYKRTELQRMLEEDINKYDVVVAWSFDRLAGDDDNTKGLIYNILDKNYKQVTSVRQKTDIVVPNAYDPKSLNVAQQRQITSLGVTYDRKMRRERFMQSIAKTVESGRHISVPPYGYKLKRIVHPEDSSRTRAYRMIDPKEAPILKRIFELRSMGEGGRVIAMKLNKEGIKSRNGGDWTGARIYQILKNSFPCGYIVWNKTQERKFGDDLIKKTIPESEWRYIPIDREYEKYYKPIISEDLFKRCKEISERNKIIRRGAGSSNILAGLLKCPLCGSGMVSTSPYKAKTPPYTRSFYICSAVHLKGICERHSVRCDLIQDVVISKISKYLNNPEEIIKHKQKQKEVSVMVKKKELILLERKFKDGQKKINSLNNKFVADKIKEDYYYTILKELEDEERLINQTIIEVRESLSAKEKIIRNTDYLKCISRDFNRKFRELNNNQKREILNILLERIEIKSFEKKRLELIFKNS
jgi:site-specific DNA recombinase